MAQLVRAPARKAGEPGSNPDSGENFCLKLTTLDLLGGYSERLNFMYVNYVCYYSVQTLFFKTSL